MPKSTSEEKHRWIKPILNGEVSIKAMAQVCPFSERSLKYWPASFREHGIKGLDNKSTKPKSQPNETPIRVKERIIELRKQENCCARKLDWKLKKENINLHYNTIGKIIKSKQLKLTMEVVSPIDILAILKVLTSLIQDFILLILNVLNLILNTISLIQVSLLKMVKLNEVTEATKNNSTIKLNLIV